MAEGKLAELRAELTEIYAQMDDALAADPDADTTALEDRANAAQDEIDAILTIVGSAIRDEIRQRPQPDPPPSSGKLF